MSRPWVRFPPLAPRRRGLYIVRDDFFIKSHRLFIPSLLLSKPNPLRWASVWLGCKPENFSIHTVAIFHLVTSFISLAPTFFKSQSALMPLLLLSNRDSLRWIRGWFWVQTRKLVPRKCSPFPRRRGLRIVRDDFLFEKVIAHSLRCSSFPNRTRFAGL